LNSLRQQLIQTVPNLKPEKVQLILKKTIHLIQSLSKEIERSNNRKKFDEFYAVLMNFMLYKKKLSTTSHDYELIAKKQPSNHFNRTKQLQSTVFTLWLKLFYITF
jgi:hypothetical protein